MKEYMEKRLDVIIDKKFIKFYCCLFNKKMCIIEIFNIFEFKNFVIKK